MSLKEGVIEKRITSSLDNSENNVPVDPQEDVPIAASVRSRRLSHSVITSKDVKALAFKEFKGSKKGITFNDLITKFEISKKRAQRKLKDCHKGGILFTPEKRKPQKFYPTCLRAEVIEYLYKKKAVPVDPTGVTSHHNPLEQQRAQNLLDILLMLPFAPPHIHKILLMLHIDREYYTTLDKKPRDGNLANVYEEWIGKAFVTYTYNKNGRVEVAIACDKNPFKLETDEDITIFSYFVGQVKDRMLFHLDDPKERGVPSESRWVLKACDLNKDIEINDKMQITLPDIQLKYADRVFRLYVKALGEKAICRGEESLTVNLTLDRAFDKIRNSYEPFKEELIARIKDMMADRRGLKTAAASGYRLYHPTWPENN